VIESSFSFDSSGFRELDGLRTTNATTSAARFVYSDLQMRVRCGEICFIALFVALPNQEGSASKQLAPHLPCTQLQIALIERLRPQGGAIKQIARRHQLMPGVSFIWRL
jgi:hypothetical protein